MARNAVARNTRIPETRTKKGGLILKLIVAAVLFIILVAILLVALAPTILGGMAPGYLAGSYSRSIRGSASADSVRLSWFGPQRLEQFSLRDEQDNEIVLVDAEVPVGLLDVLTGSKEFGEITLAGIADLRRDEFGQLNITDALAPARASTGSASSSAGTAGGGDPIERPAGLGFTLNLDGVTVRYSDPALAEATGGEIGAVSVVAATGEIIVKPNTPIDIDITLPIETGTDASARNGRESGRLAIDLEADVPEGAIDPANLGITGTIALEDVPTRVLVAAGLAENIDAIGFRDFTATFDLAGTMESGLSMTGSAPGLTLRGGARIADDTVTSTEPLDLSLDTAVYAWLEPLLFPAPAEGGEATDIRTWPSVRLVASNLSYPLPDELGRTDLRGTSADIELSLGEIIASVPDPVAGGARRVQIRPSTIGLDVADLADGARLQARLSPLIDERPAGDVDIDLTAGRLLDERGRFSTESLPDLRGKATIADLAIAAIQPFAEAAGVDLVALLGPELDLVLTADRGEQSDETAVVIDADAEKLTIDGELRVTPTSIASIGEGVRFRASGLLDVLGSAVSSPDFSLSEVGAVSGRLTRLSIDTERVAAGDLRGVSALFEANLDRVAATVVPPQVDGSRPPTRTLAVSGLALTLDAENPAERVRLQTTGRIEDGGQPAGELLIDVLTAKALGSDGAAATGVPDDLSAEVLFSEVPIRLVTAFVPALGSPDAKPFTADGTEAWLRDALGPELGLRLTARPDGDNLIALDLTGGSSTLKVGLTALASAGENAQLLDASGDATLTMQAPVANALIEAYVASGGSPLPRVAEPLVMSLALQRPVPDRLAARIKLNDALIGNLTAPPLEEGGERRRLEAIRAAFEMTLGVPRAALTDSAATGRVTIDSIATLGTNSGRGIARLSLDGFAETEGLSPKGDLRADLRVEEIDTTYADSLLGEDPQLTAWLGETLDVSAEITASLSQIDLGTLDTARATVKATAPRLETTGPGVIVYDDGHLVLERGLGMTIEGNRRLINQMMRRGTPTPVAQLTNNPRIEFSVEALTLPIDPEPGRAREPRLTTSFLMSQLVLEMADGVTREYSDAFATVTNGDERGELLLTARMRESGRDVINGRFTLQNLLTDEGVFTTENALLRGTLDVTELPASLIDVLATGGDGTVEGILGESVTLKVVADRLPADGGTLEINANSPQTELSYRASIRTEPDGELMLVAQGTPVVRINAIAQQFGGKAAQSAPMLAAFMKDPARHDPAILRLPTLELPVSGDPLRITLEGTVDPGEADFALDPVLGRIVAFTGNNRGGLIGGKLGPTALTMSGGVFKYRDLVVPLGEFSFASNGTINLNNRREHIVVLVPVGAIANDVSRSASSVFSRLAENAVIPIRRRGRMDENNRFEPDFESVIEDALSPDNLIEDVGRGLLEQLIKRGGG
ncbi:MAG: hypothetical protein AAGI17_09760 [Planctomycetota bacterium]